MEVKVNTAVDCITIAGNFHYCIFFFLLTTNQLYVTYDSKYFDKSFEHLLVFAKMLTRFLVYTSIVKKIY